MTPHACLRLLLTASVMLASTAMTASAQSAPEAALQAAFIYNFAKFTVWPTDASAGPLKMCVVGETPIAEALDAAVKGRPIEGRDIVVVQVKSGELRGCHVLFVAGMDAKHAQQLLEECKGAPVLTVSDGELFAKNGGIAGLFVEQGKMRFAINLEAAQHSRLRISSRLLGLAKIVKDDHVHP